MKKLLVVMLLMASTFYSQSKVFVNQYGFNNSQPKYVYFAEKADSFHVYKKGCETLVFKGKMLFRAKNDPSTGYNVYEGNFSNLTDSDEYFIKINDHKSYSFKIEDGIFNNLFKESFRTFLFQRCGFEIDEKHGGIYSRGACHLHDAEFHPSTDSTGKADVSGGWHDAGDYGKYIVPGASTVGMLLNGYETSPEKFNSDNLGIPESGNNVPDILDEARYELEWFLKMQKHNGALYNKVHSKDYVGWIMPEKSLVPRFIYEICTKSTASFAAIMGKSARLFKKYDKEFANKILEAAERAWSFLEKNRDYLPEGGFRNPKDTKAGGYTYRSDLSERFWAASELYSTTGNDKYLNRIKEYFESNPKIEGAVGWNNILALAYLTNINNSKINKKLNNRIKNDYISYCDQILVQYNDDGFRCSLKPEEYIWGTNGFVLSYGMALINGYELTKDVKYLNAGYDQLSYVLGANCKSISFVTQFGEYSVNNIHLAITAADKIDKAIPGFLSGGPDLNLSDPILRDLYNKETPPAQTFVDHLDSYASNEVAIYWNAPLVFVSGYFSK